MISKKKKIEALIRNALSDANLSEEARERVDEIHRSAICTAHKIAGHYDQWRVAYEAAPPRNFKSGRDRSGGFAREGQAGLRTQSSLRSSKPLYSNLAPISATSERSPLIRVI